VGKFMLEIPHRRNLVIETSPTVLLYATDANATLPEANMRTRLYWPNGIDMIKTEV